MIDLLREAGFTNTDFLILGACPFLGAAGALIHTFTTDMDYTKVPTLKDYEEVKIDVDKDLKKTVIDHRGLWLFSRIYIGAATGLVLALYFVGAINSEVTSIGRLLALSIIVGYVAPSFWSNQDKTGITTITKEVDKIN